MTTNALPTTRLQGRWLIGVRLVFAILAVLMLGASLMSYIAYWPAVGQLCVESAAQCQRQLQFTLAEVAQFENSPITFEFAVGFRYSVLTLTTLLGSAIGLFIMFRKSDDWLALLVGLFLISFGLANGGPTSAFIRAYPSLAPLMRSLIVAGNSLWVLFFILFPNGRIAPPWMKWMGPVIFLVYNATVLFPNLIEIATANPIIPMLSLGLFALLMVAQVIRYWRHSNAIERQQTQWVVFGVVVYFGTLIATAIFYQLSQSSANYSLRFIVGTVGFNLAQIIMPIAIGFAVLRSRLFDIDLIIRRTLQYSLLSGLLAFVYFGGVVIIQGMFTTLTGAGSPIALVASTLAIAALFLPLRRRVQNFIDKRFYRQKYDAQKVLAEFAATCRDETDLDKLTARLVEVMQETMQPESVELWLRPTDNRLKPKM